MRGHEALLELRRRRRAPTHVFVETDAGNRFRPWLHWPREGSYPTLLVEPSDAVQRLDLRCLVGLRVSVDGTDASRCAAVADACIAAGAVRVITNLCDVDEWGERQVLRIDDTYGLLTWHRS